jgi:hypothetical protein
MNDDGARERLRPLAARLDAAIALIHSNGEAVEIRPS